MTCSQLFLMANTNKQKESVKNKHGGTRTKLTWHEKLAKLDKVVIRSFLCSTSCGCETNCVFKLLNMGEEGVQIVFDLRENRLAGTCFTLVSPCITVFREASQLDRNRHGKLCHAPRVSLLASIIATRKLIS